MGMRLISRKTLLLFFLPGALFMGAFLIYPIITMVIDSFYEIGITGSKSLVGLDNYIRAFTAGGFLKQLRNTLIYIVVAVGVETVVGLLFALFFELDYKGSKIIRSFMMAPLMIAPLVAGLTWKLMMSSSFGIINELLTRIGILSSSSDILWLADERWSLLACCIADIWLTTPFMMLMILAGLQGLDTSMLEAARIDGAGMLAQVFTIKLPVIKPVLLTALSVRIIDAARTFDIIWAMTEGGPNRSSETISIIIYKTLTRYNDTGYASAMAVVFIAVLVIFTLVFMQSLWNPKKQGR
ncbi:ABC transporter, permease protein [Clostridiales bacterium 1_7_47FAA]|nr:ABC transporter, permease protein [Clostridiales bacterium 1_7_47FAA]